MFIFSFFKCKNYIELNLWRYKDNRKSVYQNNWDLVDVEKPNRSRNRKPGGISCYFCIVIVYVHVEVKITIAFKMYFLMYSYWRFKFEVEGNCHRQITPNGRKSRFILSWIIGKILYFRFGRTKKKLTFARTYS